MTSLSDDVSVVLVEYLLCYFRLIYFETLAAFVAHEILAVRIIQGNVDRFTSKASQVGKRLLRDGKVNPVPFTFYDASGRMLIAQVVERL